MFPAIFSYKYEKKYYMYIALKYHINALTLDISTNDILVLTILNSCDVTIFHPCRTLHGIVVNLNKP